MATPHRDVEAFGERAPGYEDGWRGRLHHDIAERTVDRALQVTPAPCRVLDVGCGTGYLLRQLAGRLPGAVELSGIDAAAAMVETAVRRVPPDHRARYRVGVAEALPFPDGHFDLVVTCTSFDHWADQRAGLVECARVLAPGGHLVLSDQCSRLLWPTVLFARRGHARTPRRVDRLLAAAGFGSVTWRPLYAVIIRVVTATVPS